MSNTETIYYGVVTGISFHGPRAIEGDEHDNAGKAILDKFEWETSNVVPTECFGFSRFDELERQ